MKRLSYTIKFIIVLVLFIIPLQAFSAAYTVKSDGSMDYTTITAAIAAASNGDTLLIYGTITGDGVAVTGININKSLTLIGQGAGSTIIEAASTYNTADRTVITTWGGAVVATIQDLTIRNGKAAYGGGLYLGYSTYTLKRCIIENNIETSSWGGGINAAVTNITITDCIIRGNSASGTGGGAMFWTDSPRTVTINNTTVSNNTNGGLAFYMPGRTANMTNCTVSGNTMEAGYEGAGITFFSGTLNITNCTITNNTNTGYQGGGIGIRTVSAFVNIKNSILAGNTNADYPDYYNSAGTVTSLGYNIIGDVGLENFSSNTTGDQYGDPNSTTTPNAGAIESASAIDPLLNALANNGGPTLTHSLQSGSPAIAMIPSPYNGSPDMDQRYAGRLTVNYSIGAVEFNANIPTLSEWAAIAMGILLAGFGGWFILRRFA